MPEMDGLQLARSIREHPALRSTKLVLLTSSARRGDARVARGSGIDGFLTKPVKTSALYDCLAAVLARTPAHRHRRRWSPPTRLLRPALRNASAMLVVDDSPVNQRVATRMLENMGHRVDVASNGREAVAAVQNETLCGRPDGLPDAGDGRLRSHHGHPTSGRRAGSASRSSR